MELTKLITSQKKKDETPITLSDEAFQSFEKLKSVLAEATYLAFPLVGAPLRICSDASNTAMGAVLKQLCDEKWKPLSFFSRKFDKAQQNYATFDRELTAIVEAVKHFAYYLETEHFIVCTDHKPLLSVLSQSHETAPPRRR
uniref:Reverse transcriptase/retrotransposon-derived protein RNase H-like domain-containing protein n=1 Tax=Trichogramma kaykai TaxID=54128 RepID=A0ABD2W689_9HYME